MLCWEKNPKSLGELCPSQNRVGFLFFGLFCRKKPFLFYFDIVKCASPLVLLEFQCPTTQVTPRPLGVPGIWGSPHLGVPKSLLPKSSSAAPPCPPLVQICVSECPDRYMTYLTAYGNPTSLDYYRNFCTSEFGTSQKVGFGVGVPVLWGDSCPEL